MNLNGANAIITGGGGGIGGGAALALANEGCNVVIAGNIEEQIKRMTEKLKEINPNCSGYVLDLSEETEINALVNNTCEQFGTVDVLISAAGVCLPRNFPNISLQEWDKVMNINLRGVFIIGQKVMNIMAAKKNGHIINISSSVVTVNSPYYHATYSSSKHGVIGLTQAMAEYEKRVGVKVSMVLPGVTDTGMTADLDLEKFGEGDWYKRREKWLKGSDIADGIVFLLKQPDRAILRNLFIDASFI